MFDKDNPCGFTFSLGSLSKATMVVGVKGPSREVVEGLEALVEEEVVEVCKKAEQLLLHGGDNSLDVDAGVKHVVFALITLVSSYLRSL